MRIRLLLSFTLCLFPAVAMAAVTAVDGTGRELRLSAPAGRIVSLAPHATELLFAAGAGERVVGTPEYSDFPEAAKAITRIGGYKGLDLEAIVGLEPDLVVAWRSGNPPEAVERLRAMGLPVFLSEPRHLPEIADELAALGRLAGTAAGENAARSFRERLAGLRERYARRSPLTVFYEVWHQPLITVNGEHIISDAIRICGGRNVFADLGDLVPRVSTEAVIAADPEVIVASGMGEARPDWLDEWRRWPSLTAVREDHLYFVPPALMQRLGPRLLDGTARLCALLERARSDEHMERVE